MHAAADVDGVDLDVAVVDERGADVGGGAVQQQRPAQEATRGEGSDGEDVRHAAYSVEPGPKNKATRQKTAWLVFFWAN